MYSVSQPQTLSSSALCQYHHPCITFSPKAMLRQVQKPLWGLLVRRERAPRLWDAMRQTKLSELLRGTRDITVYSLEE